MDFFSAQDNARKATRRLILLYAGAVLALIVSVYFIALIFLTQATNGESVVFWNPGLFFLVSLIVLIIIVIGTTFRMYELRQGGSAVARMLGGRRVDMSTQEPKERQLINVVEEMSIAAGIPVPEIYILDKEPSINAFAAGYTTRDAAVGVTRGTLEQLSRDELQGVIAHEFSHIFNGDMRINIRLIGILNGIMLIHLMGMLVMRGGVYSSLGSRSSSRGKGAGGVLLFGLALLIIGYLGVIFGRMIQAAISRKREYLADAAAVQYTRNPDGIAGALTKISASFDKSLINDAHTVEVGHLFFSSSFKSALDGLFATHPPIKMRIKAIGAAPLSPGKPARKRQDTAEQKERPDADSFDGFGDIFRPEVILAAIGTISDADVKQAGKLLSGIPEYIRKAVHEPLEAQALIFAMLLSGNDEIHAEQVEEIKHLSGDEMDYAIWHIRPHVKLLKPEWKLPVTELCIPALKQLSEEQFKTFRKVMEALIKADGKVSLFEYALEKTILHQLESHFGSITDTKETHSNLNKLGSEISVLLSAVAHETSANPEAAWEAGLKPIEKNRPANMALLPESACAFKPVDNALEMISTGTGEVKRQVLSALLHAAAADGAISRREMEWIRAMASALDCPVPLMAG